MYRCLHSRAFALSAATIAWTLPARTHSWDLYTWLILLSAIISACFLCQVLRAVMTEAILKSCKSPAEFSSNHLCRLISGLSAYRNPDASEIRIPCKSAIFFGNIPACAALYILASSVCTLIFELSSKVGFTHLQYMCSWILCSVLNLPVLQSSSRSSSHASQMYLIMVAPLHLPSHQISSNLTPDACLIVTPPILKQCAKTWSPDQLEWSTACCR